MYPHPSFDLLLVFAQTVQGNDNEIALLNFLKVRKLLHEHVRQSVILKHNVPVVTDRDCRGYDPRMMHVLAFHTVKSNGNSCKRLTATLLPLK